VEKEGRGRQTRPQLHRHPAKSLKLLACPHGESVESVQRTTKPGAIPSLDGLCVVDRKSLPSQVFFPGAFLVPNFDLEPLTPASFGSGRRKPRRMHGE